MKANILYYIYLGVFKTLAHIPYWGLYAISDFLYLIVYKLAGYRVKTTRTNLKNSFPEKSEQEILDIERKFYKHFCDLIVETIKLAHISDKEAAEHIKVTNPELPESISRQGQSIILLLGHYCNWEYVTYINFACKEHEKGGQVYRPQHDEAMDRLLLKLRSRFGNENVAQIHTFRRLLEWRRDYPKFMIGFISDQRPNSENLHNWTEFLNQDTAYAVGGEEIARRVGSKLLYLEMNKVARGKYEITFKDIVPDSDLEGEKYPYTLQYMRMFEQTIRNAPQYWLWTHKRWRYQRGNTKWH